MLFTFLKKQKLKRQKLEVVKALIINLNISEDQKEMYIKSLDILETIELDNLYSEISIFSQNFEMKQVEDIKKWSYANVAGMKKSEVEEKKKEVNAFSFLINNI